MDKNAIFLAKQKTGIKRTEKKEGETSRKFLKIKNLKIYVNLKENFKN